MVSEKKTPSVFLYIGDERYLKEIALNELKSSILEPLSKDLDYKVFYGGESEIREVLDYLSTFPFSAAKRLVLVKEVEKFPKDDISRLVDYMKRPSKSSLLVVDAKNDSILKTNPSISRCAKVVRFDNLEGRSLISWIKRFLSSRGKSVDEEAIELLKESQGNVLSSLAQEMEKLVAFVGDKDVISVTDVEKLVGKSIVKSVFDLTSAIGERDAKRALGIAWEISLSGKRVHEVIGILTWHLKRLLRGKLLQAKGRSDYTIANILGINRNRYNDFFKEMSSFGVAQLKSKITSLLEVDLDIKRTLFEQTRQLELAVIRLCLD